MSERLELNRFTPATEANPALHAEAYSKSNRTALEVLVEKPLSPVLSAFGASEETKTEVAHYAAAGVKTAGLFLRRGPGLGVSALAYGFDQMHEGDSVGTQLVDFGWGAVKGMGLNYAMGKIASVESIRGVGVPIAARGVAMGLSARAIDTTATRRTYLDANGNWDFALGGQRISENLLNKEALMFDFVAGGVSHGLIKGANVATRGFVAERPFIQTALTGTTFGTMAGGYEEIRKQQAAGQPIDWTQVVKRAAIQGGVDTLAALPGGIQGDAAARARLSQRFTEIKNHTGETMTNMADATASVFTGGAKAPVFAMAVTGGEGGGRRGLSARYENSFNEASSGGDGGRRFSEGRNQGRRDAEQREQRTETGERTEQRKPDEVPVMQILTESPVKFSSAKTVIELGNGQREVVEHNPHRDFHAVVRDMKRLVDTAQGKLSPRERQETRELHEKAGVPVPPEKLVGFFTEKAADVNLTHPIRVLRGQTIATIMSNRAFGDVGPFAVALYRKAFAELMREGNFTGKSHDDRAFNNLENLFARKVSEILPQFRKDWKAGLTERDEAFIAITEKRPGAGDQQTAKKPEPAPPPAEAKLLKPSEAPNVLDRPLTVQATGEAQKAEGIRPTRRQGNGGSGKGEEHLGQYTDFRGEARSIERLNPYSVKGLLLQPDVLNKSLALTERHLRDAGHLASEYRRDHGVGGPDIGPASTELYARVFRAMGMTPQKARTMTAQDLQQMFLDYIAWHAQAS